MREKHVTVLVVLALLVVVVVIVVASFVVMQRKSARLRMWEEEAEINWISFKMWFVPTLVVTSSVVIFLVILVLIYGFSRSRILKASVHQAKVGDASIPIDRKDLHDMTPVVAALASAKQMEAHSQTVEKAFAMYERISELQTAHIKAMTGTRGLPSHVLDADVKAISETSVANRIPTFQELLLSGDIATGRDMILAYEDGKPRRGSFLDIYSSAIAGESGSGKTSTELFLIGSGIVAGGIRFYGIDPHYPHPNGLGMKTKPLWEAGLMSMATDKDQALQVLHMIETMIDQRLAQRDTDTTPVVLVIDELAFLAKTSIANDVFQCMERISTEGRKCAVYMLASSQTWLTARTGGNSVVRDTLTSAYVHRIKPGQAKALLQDADETKKVKKYVKHAGQVLFIPVGSDSVVCQMPFTTEADMETVVKLVGNGPAIEMKTPAMQPTPQNKVSSLVIPEQRDPDLDQSFSEMIQEDSNVIPFQPKAEQKTDPATDTIDPALLTIEMLSELQQVSGMTKGEWQVKLSQQSGVSLSMLQKIMLGSRNLTPETSQKLLPYLDLQSVQSS